MDSIDRARTLLRGRVVAAALTPFRSDGSVARDAVAGYATALRDGGVGGIAVGAHTGRGAHLATDELAWLVGEFARAAGLPVVAGLGVAAGTPDPVDACLRTAGRLRSAGAEAFLVSPVAGLDRATTVRLHERVGAELGVPLVAFVLYARSSGCEYDAATLAELVDLPWTCGVKLALLDDAVTCQDLIGLVRGRDPEALVLTGEDRMYGPSLLWGADSALVGIAAALPDWSVAVLDAWKARDHAAFVAASTRLDALARLTFREPMEGYVQRMAWTAAWQGILPADAAFDPFGPAGPGCTDERRRLYTDLDALAALLS